jgi:hypothetical protein
MLRTSIFVFFVTDDQHLVLILVVTEILVVTPL